MEPDPPASPGRTGGGIAGKAAGERRPAGGFLWSTNMMRLDIRLRDPEVKTGHVEAIERRAQFALGRFAGRIQRTELVLSDANGPRGGRDKQCTVKVMLVGLPPVVVEVRDVDALAGVGRAVDRAARHVRDALSRRRDLQRLGNPEAEFYGL
jgi:hypothetical protein